MSLKYALLEAHLTPAPNDYVAQVQDVPSNDTNDILAVMAQTGDAFNKSDALATINRYNAAIVTITKKGETVTTDLFKTSLSMQGTFDGADDGFDTKRHTIHVNMQAGTMLKDAIKHIGVEKVHAPEVHPHVLEVKDAITKSVNHTLTSGGVVEIVGSMLKIAGKNAKNGVYFVDNNNKAHKAATLVDNKPARLILMPLPCPKANTPCKSPRSSAAGTVYSSTPAQASLTSPSPCNIGTLVRQYRLALLGNTDLPY